MALGKRSCCSRIGLLFALSLCAACGGEDKAPNDPTFVIDVAETKQHISGFGVSSAWTAQNITDELAEQLFSADSGVGLSLLRVRITPEGTTWETQTALKAQAWGARVWAAPWSPPGEWKDNLDPENGGRLLDQHYGAWADRLASFVVAVEAEGVALMALSAQNEPDYTAEWETCRFTPAELTTFIGMHLAPALAQHGVSPTLIAPEAAGWGSIARYTEPLLADPATRQALGIIGVHGYNGDPFKYETPARQGKELWLTEVSEKNSGMDDPGMGSALWTARLMHDDLTIASVNAWHYWWLNNGAENSGVVDRMGEGGVLTRRAYVMGNFSRFVRPGSYRLGTAGKPSTGILSTAFKSADGSQIIVVAVNATAGALTQSFEIAGASLGEVTPWITSDTLALEPQPPVSGGTSFSYELPARSVTTFVGGTL